MMKGQQLPKYDFDDKVELLSLNHREHGVNNNSYEAVIALGPQTTQPEYWAEPIVHVHTQVYL